MAVEIAEYVMGTRAERPNETSRHLIGKRFVWLARDLQAFLSAVRAGKLDLASATAWLQKITMTFLHGDFSVIRVNPYGSVDGTLLHVDPVLARFRCCERMKYEEKSEYCDGGVAFSHY